MLHIKRHLSWVLIGNLSSSMPLEWCRLGSWACRIQNSSIKSWSTMRNRFTNFLLLSLHSAMDFKHCKRMIFLYTPANAKRFGWWIETSISVEGFFSEAMLSLILGAVVPAWLWKFSICFPILALFTPTISLRTADRPLRGWTLTSGCVDASDEA